MTTYRYDAPPKTIGERFRQLGDKLAQGYDAFEYTKDNQAENKRGELQQRAQALIDASLEGANVSVEVDRAIRHRSRQNHRGGLPRHR